MALQHLFRLRAPEAPEGDPPVLGGRGETTVRQRGDRIHGAVVEAQHAERGTGLEGPHDGGLVEAARDCEATVGGHGERPDRTTVAAHLRACRRAAEQQDGDHA